jgi:hypothetical protein
MNWTFHLSRSAVCTEVFDNLGNFASIFLHFVEASERESVIRWLEVSQVHVMAYDALICNFGYQVHANCSK